MSGGGELGYRPGDLILIGGRRGRVIDCDGWAVRVRFPDGDVRVFSCAEVRRGWRR